MATKIKYVDQTRYPKVVTAGYEKKFTDNYHKQLSNIGKEIIKKMLYFTK